MSYTIEDIRNKANELKIMLDDIKNENNLVDYDDIFDQGGTEYDINTLIGLLDQMYRRFLFKIFGSGECDAPTTLKTGKVYEKKISEAIDQNLKKKMSLDKTKSYLTPDRRFIASNQYIPGKHKQGKEIKKIAIAVDCSGSMSSNKIQAIVNNCTTTVNQKCSAFKNYTTEIHFFVFNSELPKDERYLGTINSQNQVKKLTFDGCEDFKTTAKQLRKYCGDLSLCIILSDYRWESDDEEYLAKIRRQFKTLELDVGRDFA
jgi:hypothetical protein